MTAAKYLKHQRIDETAITYQKLIKFKKFQGKSGE